MLKTLLRRHLEQAYSDRELKQWFDPLTLYVDNATKTMRVSFPHPLFSRWFMETVRTQFEQIAAPCINCAVTYDEAFVAKKEYGAALQYFSKHKNTENSTDQYTQTRHTFESFLVNRKNDFPLAAAKQIIKGIPPANYIPFIIHGPSGSGKTHLLGAVANAQSDSAFFHGVAEDIFSKNVPHCTGNIFIDDLQHIATSEAMQEKAVRIIDAAVAQGKLVACTMDVHPSLCQGLSQKLSQRLISGLVVELKKPDLDIRHQYVQQKNTSFSLSKTEMLSLAQGYQDFRTLDGALNKVRAYRTLINRQGNDLALILGSQGNPNALTPTTIITKVALYYSVPAEEIPGTSKHKNVVLARQTAVFLCRDLLGLSLVQIGRIFGNRDHSSIVYIVKKIKQLQQSNKDMNNSLSQLKVMCLSSST